jgi:hypothetical protein
MPAAQLGEWAQSDQRRTPFHSTHLFAEAAEHKARGEAAAWYYYFNGSLSIISEPVRQMWQPKTIIYTFSLALSYICKRY